MKYPMDEMYRAFEKIKKVIQSCETTHQLRVANKMVFRFNVRFRENRIDDETWTLDEMIQYKAGVLHHARS